MSQYVLGEAGAKKFKQLVVAPLEQLRRQTLASQNAIDNLHPKPFEVRWTSSQISGGGYMIWLPPHCLQLNGSNESPSSWTALDTGEYLKDQRLWPEDENNHWYNLTEALAIDPELSSFSVSLNCYGGQPMLTLSSPSDWTGIDGFIPIADVVGTRPRQNANSMLVLDVKASPFDLVFVERGNLGTTWLMRNQLFQDHGVVKTLPDCTVLMPSDASEMSNKFLRLVQLENGQWCVDQVSAASRLDVEAANSLVVGKVLTQNVDPGQQPAKSVHPLWFLGSMNQQVLDLREAWYMLDGARGDARSISLTDDLSSDSLSSLSVDLHLRHFHDSTNDLSVASLIDGGENSSGTTWLVDNIDFIMRDKKGRAPDDGSSKLTSQVMYLPMQQLIDQFKKDWDSGGGGGEEISADQLSSIPSPGMFSWTESTRTIGVGGCMVCRQWHTCTSGIGAGKADGLYQLRVVISSSGSVTLAVVSDATLGQAPTSTACWIPIYQISAGKIVADYRGAFVVPTYE